MALKVDKRRRDILSIVEAEGTAYIADVASRFGVTKETVRTDFDFISEKYGLQRIHGGLKKDRETVYSQHYHYQSKKLFNVTEKKHICKKTVELFKKGDVIYVDGGSTVSYIMEYMNTVEQVTIVTPSIALLMNYIFENHETTFEMKKHKFVFLGGHVDSKILTTYGSFFGKAIEDFHFDKMILSVDAIDIKGGISNSDEVAYDIIRQVSKQANKKIVMVDHTKFGYIANYRVLPYEQLDYLVTDQPLDTEWLQMLDAEAVEIVY